MSETGLRLLLAWAFVCGVLWAYVAADTVEVGRLPVNRRAADFYMVLNMEVVAGNGYQPLELEFRPRGKAFVRDHRIEIAIEPRHAFRTELDYEFRRSIVLPQGVAKHAVRAYLPHYFASDSLVVSLYEDGPADRATAICLIFHRARRLANAIRRPDDLRGNCAAFRFGNTGRRLEDLSRRSNAADRFWPGPVARKCEGRSPCASGRD